MYLDRHNIECPAGSVLNYMRLQYDWPSNRMRWQYFCIPGAGAVSIRSTPGNEFINTVYWDRQTMVCNAGESLSRILFQRTGQNTARFVYNAVATGKSACYWTSTASNSDGGGHSAYLDRHAIRCGANEAISALRLVRTNCCNYRFDYLCCK